MPSSSQMPASSRKDNETYPAIPHSEEEIYAIVNYWLANRIINPPRPRRPPTENEKFHPRYCRYHQFLGHPTIACQKLRKIYYEGVDGGPFRTKGIFSPRNKKREYVVVAIHVILDSSSAYDEEEQEQRVWTSDPKPPDANWEEGGNYEKAFWQKYIQPESYSLPFPEAQG